MSVYTWERVGQSLTRVEGADVRRIQRHTLSSRQGQRRQRSPFTRPNCSRSLADSRCAFVDECVDKMSYATRASAIFVHTDDRRIVLSDRGAEGVKLDVM